MKKIIFLFLITNHSLLISQTQFQVSIGGTASDYAYSMIQTTDGGYAVAGGTYSFSTGNDDMYIVKLNASGALQWTRTVGGTSFDYANSIIQATDGGYAIVGNTNSFGVNGDMYIIKLNNSGTLQWTRTVGGANGDNGWSIIQTTDGGYAVAGESDSFGAGDYQMYIVKFSSAGTLQWSRTVGGANGDGAFSIVKTTDGGYAVAGFSNSFGAGSNDMYIVKLAGNGTLQWSRTVGGTNYDVAYSIIQTTDGGYAVAGDTYSFGAGDRDMYIVKLNSSGTLQWSKTVGGINYDDAFSIIQTTDGGYAVAGETFSFGAGYKDMYILKLNSGGTLQWSRTVGGTEYDIAKSIIKTTDGGYAVAGWIASGNGDMYIVKLDASGNTCGNSTSPPSQSGTGGTTTSPNPTVTSPNPTVTSPSPTVSTGGTVTTICVIGIQPISNEIPAFYELYQNYPNPFNPATKINFSLPKKSFVEIIIYDALGKTITELVNQDLNPGTYSVDWDASNFPSGVYYYRLTSGDYSETKKMVLIK